jgi:hypothetical protein
MADEQRVTDTFQGQRMGARAGGWGRCVVADGRWDYEWGRGGRRVEVQTRIFGFRLISTQGYA